MFVECNNEILLITNPIYLSSKILKNVMNDPSIGIMTIPSQFYELLKTCNPVPVLHKSEIFFWTGVNDLIPKGKYNDIYQKICINLKFEMLQFFDFLDVD